jgi:hypothetical protein
MGGEGARGLVAASVEVAGVARRSDSSGPSQERRAGGPRERREAFDGKEASLTAMWAALGIGSEDADEEGLDGFGFCRRRSRRIEGDPTGGEVLGAVAIGEEAIVSDPHEALGEHVEQKPTDKLLDREAHYLHFVAMGVVPPTEADLAILASEEALVADGDPMGIAPEVGEDLLGSAEGALGVDHPVLRPELCEEGAEGRGLAERRGLPGEVELSCLEGSL